MNDITSMSEDEVLKTSFETFQEDLEEGFINLPGDLENVINTFKEWKEIRIALIQNLVDISDKLQVNHKKACKTTVKAGSVSLVGGIAVVGGLFATSVVSLPLVVAGGVVSAFSSIIQVASSANECILSHKWHKKCEDFIKKDAESLEKLLKLVDDYIYRIQYLEKKLKEKDLRKATGAVETVYYGVRFVKAINQIEKLLADGSKILNVFKNFSKNLKSTEGLKFIFNNTAKGSSAKIAGGGLKLFSKRALAIAGVLFDVVSIASAAEDLKKGSLPKAAENLLATVDVLIQEKMYIDQVFLQFEDQYNPVITISDSEDEA